MFVVTLLLYTVLLALTGLYFYVKMKRPEGYPPGPAQWPLLGNIVSQAFCRNFTECYCYWAKKYGKVFSFKFGQYDVVIVCDYKIAKDINTWETLTSRPQYLFYHFFMKYQNLGIIFSNGELWKQNRRFTLKTLRDYGFGKKKMEGTIYEEFNILLEDIFKEGIPMGDGKVVEFKDAMTLATENIMNSFTTGKRYEKDDEEFHKLTNILKTRIVDLSFIKLMSIFPTIYHRIPDFWLKERYNERDYFYSQMKKVIQEHRKTLDPAEPRDFIDCSLIEQDRLLNSNDSKEQVFTDDNIAWTLADLFLAGSDTTSNTLRWFFLYIIHHPQYQARIQQEIDTVLGRERKPTWDDHLQMPFTEACVLEILRKVSVVPFGVDRRAEEDVVIGGYKIPKV
ncbi:unnamed protein product [Notodromas monacha]|uniref:Cytochrome P450 n=1 Tax=Notodromas monacha TaxID=399045 RepID=A0A7R9BQL3_9CRUS|nr:unnamed protein product [Notodromas monacha]CAG0919875.1 unnamed protein product [Notodromas monacha]